MKNILLDALKVLCLGLMFTFMVAGCSLFGSSKEETVAAAPVTEKKEANVPIAERSRVSSREPSSLWSESSRWNGLYGTPLGRGIGSVVLLKPTDGFRLRVANRSGKGTGLEGASIRENQNVVGSVTEVHANGIFTVSAKQSITVGVREHAFDLIAKLREADIGADDSASTDSLFDMNLKVEGENPPTPAVAEAKPPTQRVEPPAGEQPKTAQKPAPEDKDQTKEGEEMKL